MTSDRIKEIQYETAYPNSVSVQQALLKVWNECEQTKATHERVAQTVMPGATKQSLKDAFIQGYRKRAILSVLKYDSISELNVLAEFENWYANLYGADGWTEK